jgi:hypothetical protein
VTTTKKQIIRVGDTVRIVNPRWVKRVGYPLVWTDLVDEVQADPRTREALVVLGIYAQQQAAAPPTKLVFDTTDTEEHDREFVRAVAMLRVRQRGFGGDVRAIHYCPVADDAHDPLLLLSSDQVPHHGYVGREMEVVGKRTAKTGTRFPGYGCGYGEDYEYEPGGLDDCKTHVLLKTWAGEIEACDVELVRAAKAAKK